MASKGLDKCIGYIYPDLRKHRPNAENLSKAMAYYIDLFSPETYEAFSRSSRQVSGFRERHKATAQRIKAGDLLICYLTRLSRWVGVLEVVEGPFIDATPIFVPEEDPFVVRFRVKPLVWLDVERGLPMHEPTIWAGLSFTRGLEKGSIAWTGKVRGSLGRLDDRDGKFLIDAINAAAERSVTSPLSDQDKRKLTTHSVNRLEKTINVTIPDDAVMDGDATETAPEADLRESLKIQALIANIGERMGMNIWIPRSDRARVLKEYVGETANLLERLPLNYDDTTLRTIENIDVLWLRGRSIVRAFEVEHTTSIYSGILRMADLLALQPNMDIQLHLVAPSSKREKVFQEIRRPVFSLLESGPLADSCTYLSYESLRQLADERHLAHLADTVLDEYAEDAE